MVSFCCLCNGRSLKRLCGLSNYFLKLTLFYSKDTLFVLLLFLENMKSILRQRVFEWVFFNTCCIGVRVKPTAESGIAEQAEATKSDFILHYTIHLIIFNTIEFHSHHHQSLCKTI